MKLVLKVVLFTILCLSLSSCDFINKQTTTQAPSKTLLSDLHYVEQGKTRLIYKGNSLYSGDAYSSDGKTLSLHIENGQLQTTNIYHPNGNVAVFVDSKPGQYADYSMDVLKESYYFYNEDNMPLLYFYRNPTDVSVLCWRNIDKTSTSYNSSGNWQNGDSRYPYEPWINMLERGIAIVAAELRSVNG